MNLTGYSVIHESNLQVGATYFLRTRFGQGFVMASEDTLRGWEVELQPDASFKNPIGKTLKAGEMMIVPPTTGKFYEPA